ncbi:hypothetical protein L2E82_32840 [Cichorium intybus]|uniref:Uncharacterized protein n=1 Tax=Cichorium intybus TaxID=13427 RepID=A0ACB9BHZ1_CICIN|nr:hypothetical protein L2E82_32840 [Cichorium intybus]
MWFSKSTSNSSIRAGNGQRKGTSIVAVAIDKDKYSQHALKWVVEHLLTRGQTVILIHVNKTGGSGPDHEKKIRDLFLTFHCFCTRKDVQCIDVILEETNIAKALAEYASQTAIEYLVLGAASRHGFIRFKTSDVPSSVMKVAPDFCTIYVISKGKISSAKKSLKAPPFVSPLYEQIQEKSNNTNSFVAVPPPSSNSFTSRAPEKPPEKPRMMPEKLESFKSPFTRPGRAANAKLMELPELDTDISFVGNARQSTDRMSIGNYYDLDLGMTDRNPDEFSSSSIESRGSISSQNYMDEADNEMKKLKMELVKRMDLYTVACKDAGSAKEKEGALQQWRMEEQKRLLEEARLAEKEAAEKDKAKSLATIEKAEASKRIMELESRRVASEMKALSTDDEDPEDKFKYKKYTIEEIEEATEFFSNSRKIGEGGYGPVFKGVLSETVVAIKVLRPDAAQGRSQFQREVEVLSCMRHPNMVLLLGACPEYGCLIYEYMGNGSLEDRLLRRGNTPPLSWQIRFKIASEIATGILFLHQTKPEPIVHRDLKPGNILLDENFVSKISDVGLARLLPPSVTDDMTQYRMTSAAGTLCYIDPEYQQTGMLGVKSDVYSLGIMLLQLITARPAMGLSHHVQNAIDDGTFGAMLDPFVSDWPQDEALGFAKLALQCAELRRKDRPDLGKVVLPELARLRDIGEESMPT